MSISRKQVVGITNSIIERFIKGADGAFAKIPHTDEVVRELKKVSSTFTPGEPRFSPMKVKKRSTSSSHIYNENLAGIVRDMKVLYEEQHDQVNQILRSFSASESELRKARRDLAKSRRELDSLLLTVDSSEGFFLSFTDNFLDLEYIDVKRSTGVDVDTSEGMILLAGEQEDTYSKIPLPHYNGVKNGNWEIITGQSAISEQALAPGTRFEYMFNDTSRAWKQQIYATSRDTIAGKFTVRLTSDGSSIPINAIKVDPHSGGPIYVEIKYRDKPTDTFRSVYSVNPARTILSEETWQINAVPTKRQVLYSEFEFTLLKDKEDFIDADGRYVYEFGIKNLSIIYSANTVEGDLRSETIPFEGYDGETITINDVVLTVNEEVPTNTSITYYVAPDEYVRGGIFVNASGIATSPEDPNRINFASGVPDSSTRVLQSQLANWVDSAKSGQFVWEGVDWGSWEPNWQPIQPINASAGSTSTGSKGTRVAAMDNISVVDDEGSLSDTLDNEWVSPSGTTINGIEFYQINQFTTSPIPETVEIRQGKNCWVRTVDNEEVHRKNTTYAVEGTAITLPGSVVPNSVTNVIASGTVPESETNVFVGPNESATPDYTVSYTSNTVTVNRSQTAGGSSYKQMPQGRGIRFDYQLIETTTRTRFITYYHLLPHQSNTLTITAAAANDVEEARVYNLDPDTSEIIDTVEFQKSGSTLVALLHNIGRSYGWYKVMIEFSGTNTSFDPTLIAQYTSSSAIPYYAWLAPMVVVSPHVLHYNTHRDDHTKCAIITDRQGFSYIHVNDPTTATNTSRYQIYQNGASNPISADDIFASAASVKSFYTLKYRYITTEVDHLLFKAELRATDTTRTPTLRSYTLRIANVVNI